MTWNLAPECISTVFLCIIWIYSRKGNPLPSLKNKQFQLCFLMTFFSMTSNILSTLLLFRLLPQTYVFTWFVTAIYFLTTPLLGMVYFYYVYFTIYETKLNLPLFAVSAAPGILYILVIFFNFWTHSIFNITLEHGYTQERYIMLTYAIFYLYCILSVFLVLWKGRSLPKSIRTILFTFPIIAALVIIVQMFISHIILSGSAATCALLIIYLYIQNKQISIDYLTGIPNRIEFLQMLELKINKYATQSFAVIILSLKEFKLINEKYGQYYGDKLLKAISNYLRQEFSLHEGQLYRYSGDEFALLLDTKNNSEIDQLIGSISRRMHEPWEIKHVSCQLTAALGLIYYPENANELKDLIINIEYCVSMAKNDSDNHYICYFNAELLKQVNRKNTVIQILKEKIISEGFAVYYQPIYALGQDTFFTAEALLRIPESSLGFLPPNEFISIAENCGLIVPITYLVLDKVCSYIHSLLADNIPIQSINVNFSSFMFSRQDLISEVIKIIKKNNIPFSAITIEITESTLAQNLDVVTEFANIMHSLGVCISLDDFGTGYSNLTSVTSLPIDVVKLDKSLIWSSMDNKRSSIIVQNLTRAFTQLNMHTLAEGVETKEQNDFVIGCGCKLIQGFLYARPMPEAEFTAFMISKHKNQCQSLSN